MKKYLFVTICILVVASFMLAACQPTPAPATEAAKMEEVKPTEAPVEKPTEAPPAEVKKEPVTLKFLKIADELEAKAFDEMVQAWHQVDGGKWSYVSIEYDAKPFMELFPAIQKSVATGSEIDVIQADGPNVKNFAFNGILWDLTSSFTADEMKTWAPQSVVEGSFNGKFYGPPEAQSCQLMWYNVDMTDAAGLDMSAPDGWTYGESGTGLANWQKLTKDENGDGTPEVFGLSIGSGPWDYFQRIGPRTNGEPGSPTFEGISEDGLTFVGYFDTPEAIAAYKFIQDMMYKIKVHPTQFTPNDMLSGLVATTIYQDMIMGTQKDQFPDFKMSAIYPPYFKTPMCQTGSWHYGISSKTQHFDEALAFVKFAASDEGATFIWKYKSQLPANINLLNTLPDFKDVKERKMMADFFMKYGKPRITSAAYTEYNSLFSEFWNALMAGEDVETLAKDYAQQMQDAAATYKP